MGLNYSKVSLFNVVSNRNLRLDYRFLDYSKLDIKFPHQLFSQFIVEIGNGKDIAPSSYVAYDESDVIYPTVNNFTKGNFNYEDITFLDDNYKITKQLADDDIIISRSGTVGLTYAWNTAEVTKNFGRPMTAVPSGYLIVVKVNTALISPRFIQFLFNSSLYKAYFYVFGVGKTQKNIAQPEILSIPIPLISKQNQEAVIRKIEPIEAEIQRLQAQIQQPLAIINAVFAETYGYATTLWQTFGKGMTAGTQKSAAKSLTFYKVNLNAVRNSTIMRFSSRFHAPATRELENILHQKQWFCIKNIIKEPIRRGVQPRIEDDGEVNAAKTGQLKNGYFDFVDCDKVSLNYYEKNEKAQVKQGDVLIASTGKVSLGKVDYVDFEENALADGHISIIRIDATKYDPLFLTYFLRSILGTYQIERDYTGTTNQIELYATEISNFHIPDVPLSEQAAIVQRIKQQLDAQKVMEQAIETQQKAIGALLLAAIDT